MKKYHDGLLMVNLVDFDSAYGHRNDPEGFYRALREFDAYLPALKDAMLPSDACFITSDHGCDPTYRGTDHTREYGIFLAFGRRIKEDAGVGDRTSFADSGATAAELLGLECRLDGESFAGLIEKRE